jgi:hypothetical protein
MKKKTMDYLLKNKQESFKHNGQMNMVKTETKQEKENEFFIKYQNSTNTTYSKIFQINNSNIKKYLREKEPKIILVKKKSKDNKDKETKEIQNQNLNINLNLISNKITNNFFKSSSLNKEINNKNKNMKINNKIFEEGCGLETQKSNQIFKNISLNLNSKFENNNNKDSFNMKKSNKCSSLEKTSYSKIKNLIFNKSNNKKQERERTSIFHNINFINTYENTTLAVTNGNISNFCNNNYSSIYNKINKETSIMEINKDKYKDKDKQKYNEKYLKINKKKEIITFIHKDFMEISSPEELHFFQLNYIIAKKNFLINLKIVDTKKRKILKIIKMK